MYLQQRKDKYDEHDAWIRAKHGDTDDWSEIIEKSLKRDLINLHKGRFSYFLDYEHKLWGQPLDEFPLYPHNKPPYRVPDLPARVFTADESEAVIGICRKELLQSMSEGMANKNTFRLIKNCVETCVLLTKPENYIRVPSGQYIERVVNTRSILDTTNEMAQELASLPRFIAYAKVAQESEGQQVVVKYKIKTLEPSGPIKLSGLAGGFILNADSFRLLSCKV